MKPSQALEIPTRRRSPRVWLVGGGTGGHVYPALAVAAALNASGAASVAAEQADASAEQWLVEYIGSIGGMEADLVARESRLPFQAIPSAAFRGRNPLAMARNLLTLARGTLLARRLIQQQRPDVILGTGGYVCVPVFLAARLTGTPSIMYLPDVVPGLAVRFLSRLATLVACSVVDSAQYLRMPVLDDAGVRLLAFGGALPARLVVTGYPTRPELTRLNRSECRTAFGLDETMPALLVAGGSRGARSINRAIAALLPDLLPLVQIIHVCGREGDADFLRVAADALPERLRQRYHLYEYLHSVPPREDRAPSSVSVGTPPSMIAALAAVDLAVLRSGASTLGELPAVSNHQETGNDE